jgi:hypothetical protein
MGRHSTFMDWKVIFLNWDTDSIHSQLKSQQATLQISINWYEKAKSLCKMNRWNTEYFYAGVALTYGTIVVKSWQPCFAQNPQNFIAYINLAVWKFYKLSRNSRPLTMECAKWRGLSEIISLKGKRERRLN